MSQIIIKQGRVIDPANNIDQITDLYIQDKHIVGLGKTSSVPSAKPIIEIDAKGLWVLPGLVDLSVRFGEVRFLEQLFNSRTLAEKNIPATKTNMQYEWQAISKSGVTSVCCPPDVLAMNGSPNDINSLYQQEQQIQQGNIYMLGALTQNLQGQYLSEMKYLQDIGCVGVSNSREDIPNAEVMRRAFEYAHSCDLKVFLYAEDSGLKNDGVMHEGQVSIRYGLKGIPEVAETVAIARALLLIEQTKVKAHFCRLTSARGIAMIQAAKQQGLDVSADVGIAYLHLSEMDVMDFNSSAYLSPPLREDGDRQALVNAISDGSISAVCSDHEPLHIDSKSKPFELNTAGASTIECLLPLMLQLVNQQKLDLLPAIRLLTQSPAKILGIPVGTLGVGEIADVCIVDPNKQWTVNEDSLLSMGKNTPFMGWEMTGAICYTLFNGDIVHQQSPT